MYFPVDEYPEITDGTYITLAGPVLKIYEGGAIRFLQKDKGI